MTSKHDKISADLESRIGKNFNKILRNHEYGRTYSNPIGELDRYMEKKVYKDGKIQTWAYVFEIKSRDHERAYFKAKLQLYKAMRNYDGCKKADRIFLYYVTPERIELINQEYNTLKYQGLFPAK